MTINIIILLKLLCCTSNSTFAPQIWRGDDGGADHITLSELRSKCSIWGAAPQHEQYNQFDGQRSLLTGFHYNFLSSPHFWHLLLNSDIWPSLSKMANFDDQKSKYEGRKKRLPQGRYWHVLFAKNGVQIDQIWPVWLHLYFTSGYRGFPPCTLSQHPDSRETGYSNVLLGIWTWLLGWLIGCS